MIVILVVWVALHRYLKNTVCSSLLITTEILVVWSMPFTRNEWFATIRHLFDKLGLAINPTIRGNYFNVKPIKILQEQGAITQGDYYFAQLIAENVKDKGYAELRPKFSDFISRTLQLELVRKVILCCILDRFLERNLFGLALSSY